MHEATEQRSSKAWLIGLLVVVVLGLAASTGVTGLPFLISRFTGGSHSLDLARTSGVAEQMVRLQLPPTAGEISFTFDPPEGVSMIGPRLEPAGDETPLRWLIDDCASGCTVSVVLAEPFDQGNVTIRYLSNDSEYVDEIVAEYRP